MGKSKKTRWRTFEISGSQDETQTNGADVKVNGTDSSDSHTTVTSQKYSQILGDHHTNSSSQQVNKNSSSHHNFKSRSYNNKENFYNQRSTAGRLGGQKSWQRGGINRNLAVNVRDKRPEDAEKNGLSNGNVNSPTEPVKFNEDEYTRITTPRQDVLFKKGYLSRMNSNKTATNLSAPVNSTESTAASSTTTTSDPDSSVSTLSPATTPSMDYGQMDSMDYAPMYYPGYYDENGMLVIPMYNGYNYYPPTNGSSASPPLYLMPYPPYQYDPFFMTPGGVQVVDDENSEEKIESDGVKENNENAENQNGAPTASSEDGTSNSSVSEEKKEEEEKTDKKEDEPEEVENAATTDTINPELKQSFPIYPNELNSFMYPPYPNGFYNNFYYYNGAPQNRPPKMRRRKRFLSSRNSHHHQPRSAETTTDYSDDDTTVNNKRSSPMFQNGWLHHNGYNNYNPRFNKFYMDQNANHAPHEFHLNVDVQEFYPRNQAAPDLGVETKVNCDEKPNDLERKETRAPSPKPKVEATKVNKPSQPSKPRVSKKEIIEGIKSMEQQNIDLMATKHHVMTNANPTDEWNVIKKGKKVKVVKDKDVIKSDNQSDETANDVKVEIPVIEKKIESPKAEITAAPEIKKPSTLTAPAKSKKSKNRNKKKKPHQVVKQVGFEIIEPEFNKDSPAVEAEGDTQELSEEEEVDMTESEVTEEVVLKEVVEEKIVVATPKSPKFSDLPEAIRKIVEDDDVIDISDEDIRKMSGPLDLEVVREVERIVELVNRPVQEVRKVEEKVEVAPKEEIKIETSEPEPVLDPFQDSDYFNDRTNIAALERDLMENLRLLDNEFDLKSPIINPLYDFPITSAVRKWLQEKQTESFDCLFHVQNFKKLSELYEDEDDDDDEEDTESEISEKEMKSETDSDYASDFQAKANGGVSPTCSTHAKGSSSKSNKLIAAKESFCALM